MNKKLLMGLCFAILLSGTNSFADSLFGAAGNDRCGLGTMIWGKAGASIFTQTSENTTNLSTFNEISSVTTGTSGCKNSGIVKIPRNELNYVATNYHELQMEVARGNGKTFRGLAQAMNCSPDQIGLVMATGQRHFAEVYPQPDLDPVQVTQNLRNALKQNATVRRSCASLAAG